MMTMIPGAIRPVSRTLRKLFETLASGEHDRWANWQSHVHSKIERQPAPGFLVLPSGLVDEWNRQVCTGYADLSEHEQNQDRKEVLRDWPLITDAVYEWITESPTMYGTMSASIRYEIGAKFRADMLAVADIATSAIEGTQSDEDPDKATMDDVIQACAEKGYFWTFSQDRSETEILVWKEHLRHTESWVTKYPSVDGACREALRYLASVT